MRGSFCRKKYKRLDLFENMAYSTTITEYHLLKLPESEETGSGGNSGESRLELVPKVQDGSAVESLRQKDRVGAKKFFLRLRSTLRSC